MVWSRSSTLQAVLFILQKTLLEKSVLEVLAGFSKERQLPSSIETQEHTFTVPPRELVDK